MSFVDLPTLDALLETYRDTLGADFTAYRNHCHRMLQFTVALAGPAGREPEALECLQIAAAFHDIGLWTHDSLDYLGPSADLAQAHLATIGHAEWADLVTRLIDLHHRLRPLPAPEDALVEAFRRADLVDVSLGTLRFGLPAALVAKVRAAWPNAGFHKRLMQFAGRQLRTEPWRPLPMMRW